MKTTILFSNVNGNIYAENSKDVCSFNENTAAQLKKYITSGSNLVFINAPGLNNDKNYYQTMLSCFEKLGIKFTSSIELTDTTDKNDFDNFAANDRVYFLMGGNPLTQRKIIKDFALEQTLEKYEGVVIGMCAGAINLSTHSIITTDDDFKQALSYLGLKRVSATIEPNFELDDSLYTQNRIKEIKKFCQELKTDIVGLAVDACIVVTDKVEIFGNAYTICKID